MKLQTSSVANDPAPLEMAILGPNLSPGPFEYRVRMILDPPTECPDSGRSRGLFGDGGIHTKASSLDGREPHRMTEAGRQMYACLPPIRSRRLAGCDACPEIPAPDFARQQEWDIQVAKVGLTPLAPTKQVGSLRSACSHARFGPPSGTWRGLVDLPVRG